MVLNNKIILVYFKIYDKIINVKGDVIYEFKKDFY